jgi:uncharacterized protein (TIGR02186 family)
MKMKIVFLSIFIWAMLLLSISLGIEAKPLMRVQPNKVHISAFFKGQDIEISGMIPKNWEVAIKVYGSKDKVSFNKKGRLGFLWMNVGKVTYENIYNFYFLFTSKKLAKFSSGIELERLELGYETLYKHAKIESTIPKDENSFLFKQFISFKEKEGLYKINLDSITFTEAQNNLKSFSTTFMVPPKIAPGEYYVDLYGFEDEKIVGILQNYFSVDMVGFPAFCRALAFNNSLIYGILAVVLAIVVGFMVGFLFEGKKGR